MADFNKYTDEQIVKALMNLTAHKFQNVIMTLAVLSHKAAHRGQVIAEKFSDTEIEEIIKRLGENDDFGDIKSDRKNGR